MKAEDFEAVTEIKSDAELASFLARRFGLGVNSFWLSRDEYPALSILVNGPYASMIYFPERRHAGFRSIGHVAELESGELTVFFLDNVDQEQPMMNDSILSVSEALTVAMEFFHRNTLPSTIEWLEL